MSADLNLSRRPFLNPRPVLRLTILLWTAGLVFAALNVRLYWSHFSGSSETLEQEQRLAASISSEEAEVKALRVRLASFDLEWQNDQAEFLNNKIAERSFSWSQLFDRLGEVLPADARVSTLSPEFSGRSRRSRGGPGENEVELGIRGIAKNSAVLLEFIDSLFGHPSFREPNLTSESLKDTGLLDFSLSVIYEARPAPPESPPEELLAEQPPDEASESAADGEATTTGAEGGATGAAPGAAAGPAPGAAEKPADAAADTAPEVSSP